MKIVKLTDRKLKNTLKNKPSVIRGKALHIPAGISDRYGRAISKEVAAMTKEVKTEVMKLFRSDVAGAVMDASLSSQAKILMRSLENKFTKLFKQKAKSIAESFLDDCLNQSKVNLASSLKELSGGATIDASAMSPMLKEIVKSQSAFNADLIVSIPKQYFSQIAASVNNSITSPSGGIGTLMDDLMKYEGMTKRRAKFIALDQTRKTYNSVNVERSKSAGIKQGEWLHSHGGAKPRKKHKDFHGQVFDLEKGAPVGDNGRWVHPGEEVNCGCTFTPIINFDDLGGR